VTGIEKKAVTGSVIKRRPRSRTTSWPTPPRTTATARLSTLRGVVALEGAVPLLCVAAVAIGTGFAGAAMFASEAQQHAMVAPGLSYYLLTAGGIVISLSLAFLPARHGRRKVVI
jgi:hypothetical protein